MKIKYLFLLALLSFTRAAPVNLHNRPILTNTKGLLDGLDMFYDDDFFSSDFPNENYDIVYDTRQKGEENYRLNVKGVYIAIPMEPAQSFGPDFFEMIESVYGGGGASEASNEEVNFVVGNHDLNKPTEEKPENSKPIDENLVEKPEVEKPTNENSVKIKPSGSFVSKPIEEGQIPVIIIEESTKLGSKIDKSQTTKKPSETVIIIEEAPYKEKTTKAPVLILSPEAVPTVSQTRNSEYFIGNQKERPSSIRRRSSLSELLKTFFKRHMD